MQRGATVTWATRALLLAFAVPVVSGSAISLGQLIGTPQPLPGFIGGSLNADALNLYHGFGLYHDPATGYLGSVYPPGFALLVGGLDHIVLWSGWIPLLCFVASFVVSGIAGSLACHDGTGRFSSSRFVEVIGFAALAWWLLTSLENPSLYTGHLDHPAWAAALSGLLVVPAAARGSRRALAAAVLLFTIAMWTKQTAIAAPIASLVWLSLRGPSARRVAVALGLSLLVINGVLGAILIVATHGWAWRLLFVSGLTQPISFHAGFIAREFLGDHALILLSGVVIWTVAARVHRKGGTSPDASLRAYGSLLCLFLLLVAVIAFQTRRVVGGQDNDYIPVTWALILLIALGYRALYGYVHGQLAAAVLIALLLAVGAYSSLEGRFSILGARSPATLFPAITWPRPSPGVGPSDGRHERVAYYDWTGTVFSHDDRGRPYPPLIGLLNALSLGHPPNYFVEALLDRRFSALQFFPRAYESGPIDDFASAGGRYEAHFLWKLNRVIASRYMAAPDAPGTLVRRPGPEPDPWMRTCFAPFSFGSVKFYIGQGGGFWCHFPGPGGHLVLVDTPGTQSEVYTASATKEARGQIAVAFTGGRIELGLGNPSAPFWTLTLARTSTSHDITASAYRGGKLAAQALIAPSRPEGPVSRIQLIFVGGTGSDATLKTLQRTIYLTMKPLAKPLPLWFSATRGSHADIELAHLVIT